MYPMGLSFSLRQEKLYQNKLDIARKVASYIKEGEVLFGYHHNTSSHATFFARYESYGCDQFISGDGRTLQKS